MQNPVEPDQNAVVTKYSVVPQKESDSLSIWASFVKLIKKALPDGPLYFMENFYKAKVAQVENTATATMLDAQGIYAERMARVGKINEEARAQRIKNDAEEEKQQAIIAQDLIENVKAAMALIARKGGAVELNVPESPELKTLLATMITQKQPEKVEVAAVTLGKPDSTVGTQRGSGNASSIVNLHGESRGGSMAAGNLENKAMPEPQINSDFALAEALKNTSFSSNIRQSVPSPLQPEPQVVSITVPEGEPLWTVELELREPVAQQPERRESPSRPPPTFGMGMDLT